jgi:Cation transporter/ATPase, N-terminus
MSEVAPPARSERPALDLAVAARHPVDAVLQELSSTPTGLTSEEAASRLGTVSRNVLTSHKVTALGSWAASSATRCSSCCSPRQASPPPPATPPTGPSSPPSWP